MKSHYKQYLHYLLRHKYYTFLAACDLGIPIRGLLHDNAKFKPSQFIPYADFFYGFNRTDTIAAAYRTANLAHQMTNPHHYEYWIISREARTARKMPPRYVKEMCADWIGVARALGQDPTEWYIANRERLILHPDSLAFVDRIMRATARMQEIKRGER